MPPKRPTSTKTLFDDIFTSIPAGVVIDFGATNVMEEVALEESAMADTAHQLTKSATAISMYTALDDDDDEGGSSAQGTSSHTSSNARPTSLRPLFSTLQPKGVSRFVGTGGAASRTVKSSTDKAPRATFELELDASDVAVQEAKKYAAFSEAAQARDAENAQAHLAQRNAQLQETLYTGEDEAAQERAMSRRAGLLRGQAHAQAHGNVSRYGSRSEYARGRGGGDASTVTSFSPATGGTAADGGATEASASALRSDAGPSSANSAAQGHTDGTGTLHRDMDAGEAGQAENAGAEVDPHTGRVLPTGARGGLSPEEQVARMPPGQRTLYTGHCAMFRHGKDFGFIAPDVGGPDVYFTRESVFYTFTRLALRHFYQRHGLPVPPSVAAPLQAMEDAAKQVAREEEEAERREAAAETAEAEEVQARDVKGVAETADGVAAANSADAVSQAPEYSDTNPVSTHTASDTTTVEGVDGAVDEEADAPLLVEPEDDAVEDMEDQSPVQSIATVPEMHVEPADSGDGDGKCDRKENDDSAPVSPAAAHAGILPTPAVRVQQPTVSEAALAASRAAAMAAAGLAPAHVLRDDTREMLLPPPLTTAEVEKAAAAAALLTPETAQLLQWQIDLGTGTVAVRESVTFTSHWNKAAVHGKASRLLRGEHVRGIPNSFYALQVEQAWFGALFPDAIGRKREPEKPVTTTATTTTDAQTPSTSAGVHDDARPVLERYVGTVRGFVPEEQRGYLRPDDSNAQDVIFNVDAVLWDPRFPAASRTMTDRMRVCYSVCGRERQRYVATLITAIDGTPLTPANVTVTDDGSRRGGRRGGGDDGTSNKRGGGDGDGGAGGRDGGGREGRRKRAREEEEALLLFDESDYASMI